MAPFELSEISDVILESIAARIVQRFNPRKIILFGSHAWGTPHRYSDVDLLVIMQTDGSPLRRSAEIYSTCRAAAVPMDVLVRTPREVAERIKMGDPFIRRILQRGRVLYDRHSSRGVGPKG